MHQLGRAPGLLLRQPDGEVDAERAGDLALQEGAREQPRDAAHDFADEEAVGQRVVPGPGARLPPGLRRREAFGGQLPVVELLEGVRLAQTGEAGAVREEVAYEDVLLARGGELRPVHGHRGVQVEQAPVGEDVGAQGHRPLRRRPHVDQRVPLPGAGPGRVGPAAPQVGHGLAADGDGDRGAQFAPVPEVLLERRPHRREAGVAVAFDGWLVLGHGASVVCRTS